MTRHIRPLNLEANACPSIIVEATRCWRKARDTGQAVQPSLYQMFVPHDCEMLAPVFDSLMSLCENALGRPVVIGSAMALSEDESMLLGLLDGSRQRCTCIDCLTEVAASLDCAITSTQILIGTPTRSSNLLQ